MHVDHLHAPRLCRLRRRFGSHHAARERPGCRRLRPVAELARGRREAQKGAGPSVNLPWCGTIGTEVVHCHTWAHVFRGSPMKMMTA